jgi:arylsulfatase I/J
MVYWIDEAIGKVTDMLKEAGTWNNTVVIVHSDNGGPIYSKGRAGANNFPLKGGKRSNWEGGLRVNAFVSGGLLPAAVRGSKQSGLMAAWDMFATVASLAGVTDIEDHRGTSAGLPPVDSKDMWPLIIGRVNASPRQELAIGDTESTNPHMPSRTVMGGLLQGRHKLLVGKLESSGWTGPIFPNVSSDWDPSSSWQTCGRTPATGCLFDVLADPGEHVNLAEQAPDIFSSMLRRLDELQEDVFSPVRGLPDPRACAIGKDLYDGFWGPFVDVERSALEASTPLLV